MSATRRNKTRAMAPAKNGASKFWGWARAAFLVAVGGVGGAVVGFLSNYWISYRTDYRTSLSAQIDSYKQTAAPVAEDLRTFFQIAEGKRAKTEADVEALRKKLYASVTEAQLLADNIGAPKEVLSDYQNAILDLQQASQEVTGPLDAKPLVEAVNDYLLAEQRLQQAAQQSYKSFL